MAQILPSEVLFMLSAPASSSGFSNVGVPGNSWGGWVSTTPLAGITLNNLFPDVTGAENAGDQVDYACVFIWNNTVSGHPMQNPIVWIPTATVTAGGVTLAYGVDPAGPTVKSSLTAQAAVISSPTIAPSGITTWHGPSANSGGGLSISNVNAGFVQAVWIRRTATNSPAVNAQSFGLEVDFTSLT